MLNKVIFTLVLLVVATASAFGAQLVMSTDAESDTTAAVKADRLLPADCNAAIWPNIPDHCLGFAEPRQVRVVSFGA